MPYQQLKRDDRQHRKENAAKDSHPDTHAQHVRRTRRVARRTLDIREVEFAQCGLLMRE